MAKLLLTFCASLFCMAVLPAQEINDDFENYTLDERIYENWWLDWNCGGACGIISSGQTATSGAQSGYIPGDETTDAVLDLGNKIFATWYLDFYMFIPSGKEAYWNFQGEVPIGTGEWIIGNIFFNQDGLSPGEGLIDDAPGSPITFSFPHDVWFTVNIVVDISLGINAATFSMYIDGIEVIAAGTPFTSADGTVPTSLGGLNFFSLSSLTEFYIDDIFYSDGLFSVDDHQLINLSLLQNPIGDRLQLQSELPIDSIAIYNMLGQQIYYGAVNASSLSLDTAIWPSGTYILQAQVAGQSQTIRFLK